LVEKFNEAKKKEKEEEGGIEEESRSQKKMRGKIFNLKYPFGQHYFPRIQMAMPLAIRLKVEEILVVGLKDG
jgi:hypothetical protein